LYRSQDIKPENLLIGRDFSLKIIDFDVAMKVKDEDEVVKGFGTKGWMAPEIQEKSMYTVLRTIARKLSAHDPERRPSMLQVAASLPRMWWA